MDIEKLKKMAGGEAVRDIVWGSGRVTALNWELGSPSLRWYDY